ncbi:MAG: nucleotide sugar dehydrogenase, partial [Bradymonadaceae bacterium]
DPDISFIQSAIESIRAHLSPPCLVILESTTYPGTTEEVIVPKLSKDGELDEGLFVAFSPERVDPGNEQYHIGNTPKVVGGVDDASTSLAATLYGSMVQMCDRMGIDIWEVIRAAETKPFGFMPFYPGPGIGGHCIPNDPTYLSWKAKSYDFYNRFIELATDINSNMPRFVVDKATRLLNEAKQAVNGSNILMVGMAYKADVGDIRESPGLDIWTRLEDLGADLAYHDPHVSQIEQLDHEQSVDWSNDRLERADPAGSPGKLPAVRPARPFARRITQS